MESPTHDGAAGLLSVTLDDAPRGDSGAVIKRVETYALRVPLKNPIADATAHLDHWIVPVVEIHTADGRVGTGISGVHTAPELILNVVDNYFAPTLLNAASDDILGTWQRLYWLPTHWLGRAGSVHMALSCVDTALWDLAAQRAGVPLWRLLGGSAAPIETYNTDAGWLSLSEGDLVRELGALLEQGWRRVKIKLGQANWRDDVTRARAVRRAIGDVPLMCDANQRWDTATAMRLLPALEEVEMDWIEEPVHADDAKAHARLQASTRIDIAAGESIYSYQQFTNFLDMDALRVVQPDVTRVGGVTEWLQIDRHAAARGVRCVPHAGDMMQVHQHLVGTSLSDSPPLVEYIPWTREAFLHRQVVVAGDVIRPEEPGASTAIDPAARAQWQMPRVGSSALI